MKDLFSKQAEWYAQYRPVYPQALFDFVLGFVAERGAALDCATGNGQVARVLSSYFRNVCALDVSENQIRHAVTHHHITYLIARAEQTPFRSESFDLITVAQAYHWFDSERFCAEARRIARPNAMIAIWSYNLLHCEPILDRLIHRWNYETLAPYWEAERQFLYTRYDTLAFDFERIPSPGFDIVVEWTKNDLIGYLRSWSALQKMLQVAGDSALKDIIRKIGDAWGEETTKVFTFPVFLKLGRVRK